MIQNNEISIFVETLYTVIFYSIQRIQRYGEMDLGTGETNNLEV